MPFPFKTKCKGCGKWEPFKICKVCKKKSTKSNSYSNYQSERIEYLEIQRNALERMYKTKTNDIVLLKERLSIFEQEMEYV